MTETESAIHNSPTKEDPTELGVHLLFFIVALQLLSYTC